jgi:NADH dehydrogenase
MDRMQPRVVIVGGGFGGLEAARGLAASKASVTVIDRQNHHCFQPLLYQVATAALSPADIAWPIRGILRRQRNASVMLGTVRGIDHARRVVRTETSEVPYDYLVLATGATHSYFGHEEWAASAPGLKTIEDATAIRRRLLLAFEQAEIAADPAERQLLLTFVIVGGGPTGVELAGAVAELAKHTLPRDFRNIRTTDARVLLVEAGNRLLPSFPPHLSSYAQAALTQMGVEVRLGAPVTQCDAHGVELGSERIESGTAFWAAGVVASPAAMWLGVEADRSGRIKVAPDLSVPDRDGVFAIGDTAAVTRDGRAVPGVAPAAKQMGQYVARVIASRLGGTAPPPPFAYRNQGDLATIGRKSAVVKLGRLELTGFIGWVFWSMVHIYFLIGIRNRVIVALQWMWEYVTFQRGARLITTPRERPPPPD